jgi:hypothetical protein
MGKCMYLWEKRKREPYRTEKASRMKVNHRKGGGVPGRGGSKCEGLAELRNWKKVSKGETSIGKSA